MHVLLAEDAAPLRLLYETWLTADGHDVTACADGREALAALEHDGAPEAAVLDIGMPLVDGIEVCRALRALDPDAIILVQTSLAGRERAAAAAGADRVIAKPGTPEELLLPLHSLVGRDRQKSEWGREDSNLRRLSRRVYSPFPLAARAHPRDARL